MQCKKVTEKESSNFFFSNPGEISFKLLMQKIGLVLSWCEKRRKVDLKQ
jgi:hypothetical protein